MESALPQMSGMINSYYPKIAFQQTPHQYLPLAVRLYRQPLGIIPFLIRKKGLQLASLLKRRIMSSSVESFLGQRVVFANKQAFQDKLQQFRLDGPNKLSVVSDFDFTITKFYMNGVRGASCHKIIEDCGLMAAEYHDEAQGLQAKYYPLEVDPTLNMEENTKFMIEWVEKAHELLELHGLTKSVITRAVHSALATGKVGLREKADTFLSLASASKIPSLIFSAGIADVLEEILREQIDACGLVTGARYFQPMHFRRIRCGQSYRI